MILYPGGFGLEDGVGAETTFAALNTFKSSGPVCVVTAILLCIARIWDTAFLKMRGEDTRP